MCGGIVEKGLIHLYFGDGKGKTSAAMGLAARAAGNSMKVLIAQFFKSSQSGEIALLKELSGVQVLLGKKSKKFVWNMSVDELAQCREEQETLLLQAWDTAIKEACDLLILDEGLDVVNFGFVSEQTFLAMLSQKPLGLEVVLTGHQQNDALIEAADYVTEIRKVKHPFDSGVKQRRGVEF